MVHIEAWIYPQCMVSAVTGPLDVFAVANAIWIAQGKNQEQRSPLFSWSLHSPDGAPVRTPSGITLHADGGIQRDTSADVILLPGIYVGDGIAGLLQTLHAMQPLYPLLRDKYAHGSLLAANCSASFVLAEAGLLDGGHATTTWWLERAFKARYPQVALRTNEVLTEYQGILTSGAATTYLDLALHLTARYAGQDMAARVAKTLLIDANRSSQAPYMSLTQQDSQSHSDTLVLRAQQWIQKHLHFSFQLNKMADHLAVSERTIIRHFHLALNTTPTAYVQQLKIELAKRLLETTTFTLDQVCERTGYVDPSSFRRLFKRHTALSPAEYRQQFRQKSAAQSKLDYGCNGTLAVSKNQTPIL